MKKNSTLAALISERNHFQMQTRSACDYEKIAAAQGIRSSDSYCEWEKRELYPLDKISGLYALSALGSQDALERLIEEAYGNSSIAISNEERKALRKRAKKLLGAAAVHNCFFNAEKTQFNTDWLIMMGDYHLGLYGKVKNRNLALAERYYNSAQAQDKSSQVKYKLLCVKLLYDQEQLSEEDFRDLVKHVTAYDLIAYSFAVFYFERMKARKKKHGKRFKYYKSKILHCLKILEYSDGRYIDDLLKAIKKSKLIK